MAEVISFHAFTDEKDEYVNKFSEALKIIEEWKAEGYTNLRIYKLTSDDEKDDEVQEDCVFASGGYPW